MLAKYWMIVMILANIPHGTGLIQCTDMRDGFQFQYQIVLQEDYYVKLVKDTEGKTRIIRRNSYLKCE